MVSASLTTTYELLRNVQHFDQLTSTVGDLTQLSDDEFAGRGLSLFLRDTIICTSTSQVGHTPHRKAYVKVYCSLRCP